MEEGRTISPDVVDLRSFYAERIGVVARGLIAAKLAEHWPATTNDRVLGIGYATPYLEPFAAKSERVLAFMPAAQGVMNWSADGGNLAALVNDDALPLPDASIDRIFVIHCLETTANVRDLLRELWRVLVPGGRLIVVVPNRRGIWARVERTPFGYGRPFSRGQIASLLRETQFSEVAWSGALFAPPISNRLFLRSGKGWDKIGAILWPAFPGVLIVEATKLIYQGLPARRTSRRSMPVLQPALIPAGGRSARDLRNDSSVVFGVERVREP
ncbi:methyltransferase domain-containing protein [Kaistia dalseonensis]|uniref:SAM-dependent methyltransferase n=1 Tax=Kaistia dalseonensis TaxID=410840 RepID=A0ABU0H4E6_9HYPH|nr:methyltransferase domain-containing protein [Kaistia dalseonensis]MCX5494599.1 methyltransferase domain-containing protein [Kaistia dalseonensis]MDQ0437179.1 SAM-dependent methyltransferase [Kaistia dalseonensis]